MYNNRITLKGNLTRDPDFKTIQSGGQDKELVSFRIAVNEQKGNGREENVYLDIDGWNHHVNYAKTVQLSKGDRVIVDGRLKQRSWEDSNGSKRQSYSVMPITFSKVVTPGQAQGNTDSF